MVQRSFVVKKVTFDRKGRSEEEIRSKVNSLFGNLVTVIVTKGLPENNVQKSITLKHHYKSNE